VTDWLPARHRCGAARIARSGARVAWARPPAAIKAWQETLLSGLRPVSPAAVQPLEAAHARLPWILRGAAVKSIAAELPK